ncbi:MAG: uracil-DNA glycosylase [Spirochaetia bacterium]|nr:uracil-DNA glycosylase [Spirochaetia bacterium]
MNPFPPSHSRFLGHTLRYLYETREVEGDDFSSGKWGRDLVSHYASGAMPKAAAASKPVEPSAKPGFEASRIKTAELPPEEEAMNALRKTVGSCVKCHLGTRRRKFVRFGGAFRKNILVLTDLPEFYDEVQERYYAGEDGALLSKMLAAIGLALEDIHLTGALKCASAETIGPDTAKVGVCTGYLDREINLLQPRFMLGFGELTYRLLFKADDFAAVRGRFLNYHGADILFTHHPRDLMRDGSLKKEAWMDLKTLASRL